MVFKFNLAKAVSYANNYAEKDNPFFKKFSCGEDCNFVSQCLLAGSENVFDKRKDGWFYENERSFSPSWTDQTQLFRHLLVAQKGPFGRVVGEGNLMVGDLVFLTNGTQKSVGMITRMVGSEIFFVVKDKIFEVKKLLKSEKNDTKYLHILGVKK